MWQISVPAVKSTRGRGAADAAYVFDVSTADLRFKLLPGHGKPGARFGGAVAIGAALDRFGGSVAISGDGAASAIVGAIHPKRAYDCP